MRSLKSCASCFLFSLFTFFPLNVSAHLFGSDDEKWKEVFDSLKKINSRLVNLKTSEMASLKNQLEDLLRQIEEIKQTLPQLQGAVELNKSETIAKINRIDSKIADLEAEVKNQVLPKISQQNKTLDRFKDGQKKLKEALAQDIEQFEKANKENFQSFAAINKSALEKVVQSLAALDKTTKQSFEDTKKVFISDVIPAMAKENKENRTAILQRLSMLNETSEKALIGLTNKNQKLIEVFEENIIQGIDTRKKVGAIDKNILALDKNLTAVNKNIAVNNKNLMVADEKINKLAETMKALQIQHSASGKTLGILKTDLAKTQEFDQLADEKINKLIENSSKTLGILKTDLAKAQEFDQLADEKINKLIENSSKTLGVLKTDLAKAQEFDQLADEKINKLIENSSQLTAHADQLEKSVLNELRQSAQKENSNQDKIDLANERLSRLIEILKAMAIEQEKLGQEQSKLSQAQEKLGQEQSKLSQAQEKLGQEQSKLSQVVKVQSELRKAQAGLVKNQESIKEALADLRRKANVNISRGDDIKKTLRDMNNK